MLAFPPGLTLPQEDLRCGTIFEEKHMGDYSADDSTSTGDMSSRDGSSVDDMVRSLSESDKTQWAPEPGTLLHAEVQLGFLEAKLKVKELAVDASSVLVIEGGAGNVVITEHVSSPSNSPCFGGDWPTNEVNVNPDDTYESSYCYGHETDSSPSISPSSTTNWPINDVDVKAYDPYIAPYSASSPSLASLQAAKFRKRRGRGSLIDMASSTEALRRFYMGVPVEGAAAADPTMLADMELMVKRATNHIAQQAQHKDACLNQSNPALPRARDVNAAKSTSNIMTCTSCGSTLGEKWQFCLYCGHQRK